MIQALAIDAVCYLGLMRNVLISVIFSFSEDLCLVLTYWGFSVGIKREWSLQVEATTSPKFRFFIQQWMNLRIFHDISNSLNCREHTRLDWLRSVNA